MLFNSRKNCLGWTYNKAEKYKYHVNFYMDALVNVRKVYFFMIPSNQYYGIIYLMQHKNLILLTETEHNIYKMLILKDWHKISMLHKERYNNNKRKNNYSNKI